MQKLKLDRPMTINELTTALELSENNNKSLKTELTKFRLKCKKYAKENSKLRNENNKYNTMIATLKFELTHIKNQQNKQK